MLTIRGNKRLAGRAVAPPDKSIVHRALILAAMGRGESVIPCAALGADNRSTAHVLGQLGVDVKLEPDRVRIMGVEHPAQLKNPTGALDCGNSGTTMRLMAGVLSATRMEVTMIGDASLSTRPMARLAPLARMGAFVQGQGTKWQPPLWLKGNTLVGRKHELATASAQVKSAILLAGLWAEGETIVIEPSATRDHTERMLRALGAAITFGDGPIRLSPLTTPWAGRRFDIAPDLSSAAFLLGAALLTGSPDVAVTTAVNPTRTGVLDVLRAFGAEVRIEPLDPVGEEPVARVSVRAGEMHGATIEGALTVRAIDELPLLAAIAAFIPGQTIIKDAAELRVKECDRITETVKLIRAFGGVLEETPDGFVIEGGAGQLRCARIEGGLDHRIAMTAAVLALAAPGESVIEGAEVASVSFPRFAETLAELGADIR